MSRAPDQPAPDSPAFAEPPPPEKWVDEFGNSLFRFAMSQLGDPEVAEDLVQETFLAALRARETFAGRASFLTWLLSILRRKIIDWRRRQQRQSPITAEPPSIVDLCFDARGQWVKTLGKWPANPTDELEKEEFWSVFDRCVEQLPSVLAEAFRLRELLAGDIDEVCEVLSISRGNLAVRLHRARLSLRSCLEDRWFDE